MIHTLSISKEMLIPATPDKAHKIHGKNCFVAFNSSLEAELASHYRRAGLCLKIFTGKVPRDPLTFKWTGTPLVEATRVQNIFAWYDLAPRVYDVVKLSDGRLAQVTQWATGEGKWDYKRARRLCEAYRLGLRGKKDARESAKEYVSLPFKWVGKWYVDFGRFYFTQPKWYEHLLRSKIQIRKGKKVGYQEFPQLGIPGQRRLPHRLRHMRLDEIDFEGKTVMDLGCNLGAMCREACNRGAARVIGVDDRRVRTWHEANNWISYWNIDFIRASLPRDADKLPQADIVFCLAIAQHVKGGLQEWMAKLAREVFLFEGTWNTTEEEYRPTLEQWFPEVELSGWIRDEDRRPMFRCWRIPRPAPPPLPQQDPARMEAAVQRGLHPVGRVMLRAYELARLYTAARSAPEGPAVEVGVADGSSLVCWGAAREGKGELYFVDLEETAALQSNLERCFDGGITGCVMSSTEGAKVVPDGLAFCFIDADHTQDGISADLDVWPRKVRPEGVLAFHDYDPLEAERGKGYAVYQEVNAWWADNPEWEFCGTVGRVGVFRRPNVVSSVTDRSSHRSEDVQDSVREGELHPVESGDRTGALPAFREGGALPEGVQEAPEPDGEEEAPEVPLGDSSSC